MWHRRARLCSHPGRSPREDPGPALRPASPTPANPNLTYRWTVRWTVGQRLRPPRSALRLRTDAELHLPEGGARLRSSSLLPRPLLGGWGWGALNPGSALFSTLGPSRSALLGGMPGGRPRPLLAKIAPSWAGAELQLPEGGAPTSGRLSARPTPPGAEAYKFEPLGRLTPGTWAWGCDRVGVGVRLRGGRWTASPRGPLAASLGVFSRPSGSSDTRIRVLTPLCPHHKYSVPPPQWGAFDCSPALSKCQYLVHGYKKHGYLKTALHTAS